MLKITTINLDFLLLEIARYIQVNPEPNGFDYSLPLNEWDCDMFATFVCDCVLTFGEKTNQDFNKIVGLDFANDTDIFNYSIEVGLPHGVNYDQYKTVRSFLYDIWEQYKKLF